MEKFNIEFKRGERFALTVYYVKNDGTIFNESTETVSCEFTIKETYTDSVPAISVAKGAGITYTPADGSFKVIIPHTSTSGITWTKGVYDMWIESEENGRDYVLDGTVTVLPNVG